MNTAGVLLQKYFDYSQLPCLHIAGYSDNTSTCEVVVLYLESKLFLEM